MGTLRDERMTFIFIYTNVNIFHYDNIIGLVKMSMDCRWNGSQFESHPGTYVLFRRRLSFIQNCISVIQFMEYPSREFALSSFKFISLIACAKNDYFWFVGTFRGWTRAFEFCNIFIRINTDAVYVPLTVYFSWKWNNFDLFRSIPRFFNMVG